MNKYVVAALSFTAGVIAGFAVGYFISIEKDEETTRVTADDIKEQNESAKMPGMVDPAEAERPSDDDPDDLVSRGPAHIAQPGQKGINYHKVNKIISENGYTSQEEIEEVLNDPDNEETYEERQEREEIERTESMSEYRRKNKDKIVPVQKDEVETDFRDVDYEIKDLYYFTTDDVLTDEDGNHVDEAEFIGTRPRQFGWMENSEEVIYIRNNPKETDFKVWKQRCASTDWWS